jgi:two-component system response regulator NreC
MALKLVVADDHRMVRQGLCALLRTEPDFQLVGEAADGVETLRLVERLRPDVVVLDLMMPGVGGLEVARQTARRSPRTRTVVVSIHKDEAYVVEALRAGAVAYVLKDSGAEELFRAIREAAAGRRYISASISESALEAYVRKSRGGSADPFDKLTSREREVFQLTAEGHSGGAIAERLFISPRTVESHRANLMRKLGLGNHKELIHYAARRGMLAAVADLPAAEKHGDGEAGLRLEPRPE